MGYLRSYAAIGWSSTSDTVGERVHLLGVPLRMTRPGFSQATYRSQSMDRSVFESLVVPSGAHELIGDVRYDGDSQGLIDMLVAGSANTTLTYYQDVRDPTTGIACKLVSPVGPELEVLNDPQRATFGDTSITLRLRRTDQEPFTEQYIGTNVLFAYRGGGSLQGFTYTRATATTRIDKGRGTMAAVASGQAATSWYDLDGDGLRETPALSLSPARTNLCLQSENFGTTWAAVGTPTRSAAAGGIGSVVLDLIGDDSAAALEGYTQTVTFTGNAVKAVSLFVAQNTSTTSVIRLRDTTAGADRLLGVLTWAGGLPVLTMATGTFLGYDAFANGYFRLHFVTTSVTAASTNSLQVYPATTSALLVATTGELYVGGVQAENALYPGPYIPTTTVTVARNADVPIAPFLARPQAMTLYVRFIEQGGILSGGAQLWIGSSSANSLYLFASGGFYRIEHRATVTSAAASAPTYGQVVELVGTLSATGVVQLTQSINGAVPVVSAASGISTVADAWSSAQIGLGISPGLSLPSATAILNACVVRGVQDMATMRRIALVS